MQTNDVVSQYVYFTQQSSGKTRPLLVVATNSDKYLVYKITSKYENKPEAIKDRYFPIEDWEAAGLNKPSYVDTYSGTMWLPTARMNKKIGHLTDNDILRFQQFLNQI